jgi:hypothetical protein
MKFLSLEAVLKELGGPNGLRRLLYRAEQPVPSHRNIHAWREKGWIPDHWVGCVLWGLHLKNVKIERYVCEYISAEPPAGD